jgi:Fe-coproporphyrin III synthase
MDGDFPMTTLQQPHNPLASDASTDSHRMTQLPVLVLHVHSSCNCRCVMCDIWKTNKVWALEPADLQPHLNSIRELGVRWIVFTGGEPLLNRALPRLCRMLRYERIHLTLLTTGLLLKRYAQEVADSFDDVIVSLDGPEPIHDQIRRVNGGFAVMSEGIASMRNLRNIRITGRCTVQKANFQYLRDCVNAAAKINLDGISFLAADLTSQAFNRELVWPLERQNEIGLSIRDLPLLQAEVETLIREKEAEITSGFVIESAEKLRRIVGHFRAHLGLERPQSPQCNAPWKSAVVELDGSVRPCFFQAPIGSVANASLADVINSEKALQFRSTLDVPTDPTCNRCVCSLNYRS